MEYGLALMHRGSSAFVPLSKDEYEAIGTATDRLLEYTAIEEKFDLIVENLMELEMAFLEASVQTMLQGSQDHRWFQDKRRFFNRRLLNFMSAAKAYVDQVPQHFHRAFPGDQGAADRLDASFSEQYDARIGYRTMEALRNYAQHNGDPLHSASFGSIWDEERTKMKFSVEPVLHPSELRARNELRNRSLKSKYKKDLFKITVLKELEEIGDQVDIKFSVRDYIEGLWAVHAELRDVIGSKVKSWIGVIREAMTRFQDEHPSEKMICLAAVIMRDNGSLSSAINVAEDFLKYIDYLVRKNSSCAGLARKYVSSEIAEPKK